MEQKRMIWFGMIVGSAIGSYIPVLWGAGFFSMSSVICTAVGGFLGIYVMFKVSR